MFVYFMAIWYILRPYRIFCGHWSILRPYRRFCGHLVHFMLIWFISRFWYVAHIKIWQPLVRPEGLYFAIIAKGTRGRKQAETDS
jgi:hypothetical protein